MNNNLPFVIPAGQVKRTQGPGGKGYRYFGDPKDFPAHRGARVQELNLINLGIIMEEPTVSNPEDRVFLDVKLDPKATAKSNIPVELFDDYSIDIDKRIAPNELIISGSPEAIEKMQRGISEIEYVVYEEDIANRKNSKPSLLSAISEISKVDSSKKVEQDKLAEENYGIAYFYKSISEVDAKKIQGELLKSKGIKTRYLVAPSGATALIGKFSKIDVGKTITDDYKNPFAKFEPMEKVRVTNKSLNTTYPINTVDIDKSRAKIKIGVIDGGIEELSPLAGLIAGRLNCSDDPDSDKQHGTMVASRIIFGNNIEDQLFDEGRLVASAKVVDIKVMDGDVGPYPSELIDAIKKAIEDYPDVKIFNLSIGNDTLCVLNKKSYLTRELDALSYNHKILFVVAAGNRDDYTEVPYPDILFTPESTITSPADVINGLSVGSLAEKVNRSSIALVDEPSPFTRIGFDGLRKPDLVHYGGNARKDGVYRDLGVKGLHVTENELFEDIGTSHAASLVTKEAAHALSEVYGLDYPNQVELAKALTVHSASHEANEASSIQEPLDRVVGHGIPDTTKLLDSDNSQIVYIFAGDIGGVNAKTHKREPVRLIDFTIPDELKALKRKLNVRATLCYFSEVDPDDDIDIALSDVSMTLYNLNSRENLRNTSTKDESDYSYKPKWTTVKTLEKTYNPNSYSEGNWQVRLTLQTRGSASSDDYMQPFALVVTVEDVGDEDSRINLQEIVKLKHKQYVRLSDLKVSQRVS